MVIEHVLESFKYFRMLTKQESALVVYTIMTNTGSGHLSIILSITFAYKKVSYASILFRINLNNLGWKMEIVASLWRWLVA